MLLQKERELKESVRESRDKVWNLPFYPVFKKEKTFSCFHIQKHIMKFGRTRNKQ